jgi:hypothetical protein
MTNNQFIRPTLLIGAAALLGACATRSTVNPTESSRSYSPVCLDGVAVFEDFTSVPMDYYEVAYITTEQNAVYTDKGQAVTVMRRRAGEQGGNAVVVNSVSNAKSSVKILGAALGTNSSERQGKAVAIYMPGDSMRVKNACGKS